MDITNPAILFLCSLLGLFITAWVFDYVFKFSKMAKYQKAQMEIIAAIAEKDGVDPGVIESIREQVYGK